jgi:Tol biopolymer transport system component
VSFVRITIADETQSALFTVDLRSGRERQLTPFSEDVAIKQAWSPDGRRLTYTRAGYQHLPGISSNVVTIRRNGSGAHQVTSLTGGDSNAFTGSYSPDGQWIVYRLETPTSASLVKVHPWGGEPVTIFDIDGVRPRFIDWGPAPR